MQRFFSSAASSSAGSAERPATPSHLLLISVSMSGDQQKLQVEVTCLVGQLGVVSLGPGRATAWDLVRQVHAEFPPPCGMFWKLVTDNEPMTDKDFVVTEISTVTCVKYAPAEHEHQGAIRAVEELLSKGHSLNTLPLEKHLIWLTMQSLTFGGLFNQSIDDVTLPSGLHSLTFGTFFNQRIDNVTLPSDLQSLTFGFSFNQSMVNVTLPSGLQSLTFGTFFNQRIDNVTFPSGLQSLTFGGEYNQSMDNVTLPSGLQSLTFGGHLSFFNQSMDNVTWPSGLQSLTFSSKFNQSIVNVTLPSGLQSLTFGEGYNQRMDNVTLPSGLQSLTFGEEFDWSIGCRFFRRIVQNPSSDRDCISFCHLQLKKSKV